MQEQWKKIAGFEGYEVSNLGRVRSFNRRWHLMDKPHLLGQITIKGGYKVVRLNSNAIKNKGYLVHRLVFAAFIKPIPEGYEINHKDADPKNNALDNLELCTHKESVNYGEGIAKRAAALERPCLGIAPDGRKHIFSSPKEAAKFVGTTRAMIYAIQSGVKKTIHGWKFYRQ